MKKIITALCIIIAGAFSVHAQESTAAQNPAEKMVDRLDVICRLTPDQKEKVRPVIQAFTEARVQNKKKYANDPEGLKTANKENGENLKAQLKVILTPDQFAAMQEAAKEKKEKSEAAAKK